MNETQKIVDTADAGPLDLLIVLAKRKRLIAGLTIGAALVSAAVSFVLPEVYTATTKLLPPQQAQSGASAILSQLGALGGIAAAGGLKNPNELYVGMLSSRTIADNVIAKNGLVNVYQESSLEKTRRQLRDNSKILSGKDGLISIEVDDENPERAAQLANSYVAELLKLTKVLAVTEASQRRLFFERQLESAKDNLARAEVRFKDGMESRGVISVDADTVSVMETVGRMRAQIAAKEIQLRSMSAFVTKDNQEYKRVQEELNSLRSEFSKLQNGSGTSASSTGDATPKGLANIQILRDVKYYQMLYELLAKQYEVARLDEARDASIIQVLDVAVKPELRSRPKRAIIVLISTAVGLLLSIALAFLAEKADAASAAPGFDEKRQRLRALLWRRGSVAL